MSGTPTETTHEKPKAETSQRKSSSGIIVRLPPNIGWLLLGFPLVWFVFVVVQGWSAGRGFRLFDFDFSLSGAFGDSFGGLSAIMASAAALGAWAAVTEQRAATAASEAAALSLEQSSRKRDFETTFFSLLSTFLRLSEGIDVGYFWSKKTGKDAFSEFVSTIYSRKRSSDNNFEASYLLTFFDHEDDLAHYIRNLFNLIYFVKDNCPSQESSDAYFYVRMVRSTLSQPELVILALNGMFHDEGRRHFKPVIEEFALLNNISDKAKADFDLEDYYEQGAFRSRYARPTLETEING